MVGYHYTSLSNWHKIKLGKRLDLYKIKHKNILNTILPYTKKKKVIYIFKNKQKGIDHIGCLLYHFVNKKEFNIVQLKIIYNKSDCLQLPRKKMKATFTHNGELEADGVYLNYHKEEPIELLFNSIPIKNIKLIKKYNLKQLLGA